jgi:uncharacterized protein YndB with AHSA1/START domain
MSHIIHIQVTVAAPIEKTWDYYTNALHIQNWNFATEDWHCPEATSDLQVGGKFSYRMEAKDGSFAFDFEGAFDEVKINEKLAYTISDGRKVEVFFEDHHHQSEVRIHFEAEEMNPAELQQQGWQAILNNFKMYVEHN